MPNAIENPLYGIELGSIVTEAGKYGATVLKPGLTVFIHQQSALASMSGNSAYVYSDQMNQGSFSCAVGAGVSGLAKVSGAVTGYIGKTAANSDNTLSINLNLIKWAGVEHVNFNEINAAELLAGLKSNAKAAAQAVLDKFVNLQKAKPDDEIAKLTDEWVRASEAFFQGFGTGLVVGVVWGGWGTVKLVFHSVAVESQWEGGGSASFSYASASAAGDLAATYGHTENSIGKSATASLTYFVNGACVEADTKAWFEDLRKKASEGLASLGKEPVSHAAAMSGPIKPPEIPEFNKPKPEKKVTDLIGGIDSLEGLETYAQAAAFEKQKKAGGTDDLSKFLASAKKQNNVDAILDAVLTPYPGDGEDEDDVVILDEVGADDEGFELRAMAPAPEGKPEPAAPGPDKSSYEPMGIWTMNWGRLFPWLVSGSDNRIPPNAPFRDMIRLKTLHQDFLSLSRLYARIHAAGPAFTLKGVAVDFKRISDAFAHGAAIVGDFLMTEGPKAASKAGGQIDAVINGLGADVGLIYSTWCKNASLRKCELGAGMLFGTPVSQDAQWNVERRWYTVGSITKYPDYGHLNAVPNYFSVAAGNFDTLSQAVKCWPFVLPNGFITAFVCDGKKENSGILACWYGDPIGAYTTMTAPLDRMRVGDHGWPSPDRTPLGLKEWDSCVLVGWTESADSVAGGRTYVNIWPIPFTAARGIDDWKGAAVTTGMGTLPKTLADLRGELSKVNQWSFDSDYWAGEDWKAFRYSMQMRPSYIGVVDEPPNVFGRQL